MKKFILLFLLFLVTPAKSDNGYNYALHIWDTCKNGRAVISVRNTNLLSLNTCNTHGYPLFAINGAHAHSPPQSEIDAGMDLLLNRKADDVFESFDPDEINNIASFFSRTIESNKEVMEILNNQEAAKFMTTCLNDFYVYIDKDPDGYKGMRNESRYIEDSPDNKLGCSLVYSGTSYINGYKRQQPVASVESSELVLVIFIKISDGSNIMNFISAEAVRRYNQCKVCLFP